MSDIKYMNIKEFVDEGYLQEINRQILHPAGLALEVQFDENGNPRLSGVQDHRNKPEGMGFADEVLSKEKAKKVKEEQDKHAMKRAKMMGSIIQPIEEY